MFFPSSGFRNPLPFLGTYESEPWEKIIPRKSDDDSWHTKEGIYLGLEKNIDVVELLKGPDRDFLIKKKKKGRAGAVRVPIEQELKGCYVIVACFLAPVLSASRQADPCHALIRLSEEVSARRLNPECKIVIVTKVRECARELWTGRNVEQVAFNKFFSGFPKGFLAIPFSDYESRDRVFSSLSKIKQPFNTVLIVDPNGKVLDSSFYHLCSYGAAFYPFSIERFRELSLEDRFFSERLNPFRHQGSPSPSPNYKDPPLLSLAELFNHSPEDVLLAKICGPTMTDPSPLSTLMKGQLVALYLCADGGFMDKLVKIYLQCQDRVPKLEVVVVPLAFSDYPHSYYHQIMPALVKRNISSWWTLHPYDDKIMRTLSRISEGRQGDDMLILLPAVGENYSYCGDVNARAVLSLLKVNHPLENKALPPSMHPFTTEKLFLERISSLRTVNLRSLLSIFKPDLSSEDYLEKLQGRNVLMCLAHFSKVTSSFLKLSHKYPEIKGKYAGCQLIGVPESENPSDDVVSMVPWLFLLPGAADSMSRALYFEDLGEERKMDHVFVAFGGDGRILSRHAHLSLFYDIDNLFEDVLSQEVYGEVIDDVETEADIRPYYY